MLDCAVHTPIPTQRAQRLTASEVSSVVCSGKFFSLRSVLNALRHQRYLQVQVTESVSILIHVLNALRHQRYLQLQIPLTTVLISSCAQRLTASEVSSGIMKLTELDVSVLCSTPYGIRGIFSTDTLKYPSMHIMRAQRLTASEVSSDCAVDPYSALS